MKKLALIFGILVMGFSAKATSPTVEDNFRRGYDGNAYIFVEENVEFSIFPDGQFDFVYVGPQKGSQVIVNSPNVNISFNSGYNYDAFVQYDDYGAVIQVENVPIYYDEFGRITRAGNVDIRYNDRRIVRVGGLHVVYNHYGYFSHCTGMINRYNPYYIYRPWHSYYAVPYYTHVVVYDYPYRRYYQPIRYSYHDHIRYYRNRDRVAYQNTRREFYRPGSRVHQKDGRIVRNNDFDPNRQNTMIANSGRNNEAVGNSRTAQSSTARANSSNSRNTERTTPINRTNGIESNTNGLQSNTAPVRPENTRNNQGPSKSEVIRSPSNATTQKRKDVAQKREVPSRTAQSNGTVRNSNSQPSRSSAVNAAGGRSTRQSNSARTRG